MEPPEAVKTIDMPKLKRDRVPDETGKKKGEWSQSKKGSTMHCKKCGEPNHNTRGCYNDNTQGVSSSSRNYKKKCNDTTSTPRVHHSGGTNDEAEIEFQTEVETQQSVYSTTQPYGPEVGTEEDSSLRPMVVSEVTRLEERKKNLSQQLDQGELDLLKMLVECQYR